MVLSDFFKVKVAFKLTSSADGNNLIEFYSPYKEWQEHIKSAFGEIFQTNLYYDDYSFGPTNKLFAEIYVKAPLDDIKDFLVNQSGFTRVHQDEDRIINHMLVGTSYVLIKKMNRNEFSSFLRNLKNLKFVPELSKMMEHLIKFSRFRMAKTADSIPHNNIL